MSITGCKLLKQTSGGTSFMVLITLFDSAMAGRKRTQSVLYFMKIKIKVLTQFVAGYKSKCTQKPGHRYKYD